MTDRSNIESADYTTILIDTCIFMSLNMELERGLLKKLNQFKWLPIDLLIPDIIEREILPKLAEKVTEARRSIRKAVRQSKAQLQTEEEKAAECEVTLLGDGSDEEFARQRFEAFIDETAAVKITCLEHANMPNVLDRYFKQKPPFGTKSDKKAEFPDAIALSAVESWARENEKRVLAVSTDKDWHEFTKESEFIDCVDDLAKGLTKLQTSPEAFNFSLFLSHELLNNRAADITKAIENHLSDAIPELDTYPDASSSYYYDADLVELVFSHFEYVESTSDSLEVEPIHIEDELITLDFEIEVHIDAYCNFTFMVRDPIDKDYVPVGSLNAQREVVLNLNVLVTLECDFTSPEPPFSVVEVELIKPSSLSVDFDYVDPAYNEEDYYDIVNVGEQGAD